MTRQRFMLIVAAFAVLVTGLIIALVAGSGDNQRTASELVPSASPSPSVRTIDDLYRSERQLNGINVDKYQEDLQRIEADRKRLDG